MTSHFDGRVAIITGAGRGLGRAYALLLARLGAKVCVNNRTKSKADEVVAEIATFGGKAIADGHDVATHAEGVVDATMHAFGRIDILVNNAGQVRNGAFHKMTVEQWEDVIQTHLHGAFRITRAAWPIMKNQRYGRIAMVTSGVVFEGSPGTTNYSAAKGAVTALALSLAQEGAKFGIAVNALATGGLTRLTQDFPTHTDLASEHTALGVAYFCHERCSESGAVYRIAGRNMFKLRWQAASPMVYDTEGSEDDRSDALLTSIIHKVNAGGAQDFDSSGALFPQERVQAEVRKLLATSSGLSRKDSKL